MVSQNPGLTAGTAPKKSKLKSKKLAKLFRKSDQSSSKNSSSATVTPETTPTSSLNIPERAVQAVTQQGHAAERLQSEATLSMKLKWVGGQKKEFEKHLEEIHASNDFIRDIVSMRTLGNIYNILVVPEFKGDIPEEVLSVQNSLHGLHHALNHSNQASPETKPVVISIRVMEAAAYVQLRKRLTVHHDYIPFHENSALYPLQVQPSTATSSTVVLAETPMAADEHFAGRPTDNHLSEMLLSQSVDAYEALKEIGSITKDPSSLGCHHRLLQDISTSWTVQNTLADLIKSTSKFRTYMHLAVKVSISYMYLASIGTPHQFPRLIDYRYYGLASEAKKELDPDEILEPFLSAGFGSRAPRRSTQDIGGTSSQLSGDEAMMGLGLVLHELGCWKTLDEQDPSRARDTARGERKDLQASAGTTYAEIVDVCFAAKAVEWERHACAANIYRKVVAPLQKLVSDLRWD